MFRKPSYVIARELSLHLGEIIIFKEMTEDEKEDTMLEELIYLTAYVFDYILFIFKS